MASHSRLMVLQRCDSFRGVLQSMLQSAAVLDYCNARQVQCTVLASDRHASSDQKQICLFTEMSSGFMLQTNRW